MLLGKDLNCVPSSPWYSSPRIRTPTLFSIVYEMSLNTKSRERHPGFVVPLWVTPSMNEPHFSLQQRHDMLETEVTHVPDNLSYFYVSDIY